MNGPEPVAVPLPAAMLRRFLERRGAASSPHMRDTLLDHLVAVHDVLVGWRSPGWLAAAGLLHSFYGSDRLDYALGGIADRPVLQRLLGARAEELVWLYAGCDVDFLRAAVLRTGAPAYRDHRTGAVADLPQSVLVPLCELLAANEAELAGRSPTYRQKQLARLEEIAAAWANLVSPAALAGVRQVLAAPAGAPVARQPDVNTSAILAADRRAGEPAAPG